MKTIGYRALQDTNEGMDSVIVEWPRPLAVNEDIFRDITYENATLYVPEGTAQMYMAAPTWIKFVNILEYNSTAVRSINIPDIRILTDSEGITISGAEVGSSVCVFSISGTRELVTKLQSDTCYIPFNKKGIYIIKIGSKNFKVLK